MHLSPSSGLAEEPAKDKEHKQATKKKTRGKFTIGKDTTYVTGPLDKDGYIDYVAAVNERLRKGVTPANNANVLLWQAHGPHPTGAPMPAEFFKWLGIPAPPENGDYFTELGRYMKDQGKDAGQGKGDIYDQLDRAAARPWTAKDHPNLAGWLKTNEKPLALVVAASKRTHYYSPLVPGNLKMGPAGLRGARLAGVERSRQLARALCARAMLRTSQGATDEAWQDLLACHQLGRLVSRGGTLYERMVGMALDNQASKADLAFLDSAKLDVQRVRNCVRDLQELPPRVVIADQVDLGERFVFLDMIMMIDRHGFQELSKNRLSPRDEPPNPFHSLMVNVMILTNIDWDPALRNANRWYDKYVAALRQPKRGPRERRLEAVDDERRTLKGIVLNELDELLGNNARRGKVMGDISISLHFPAVGQVQRAADRTQQVQDNVVLAFALAWYRAEHGRYPKKLDALARKYLPRIPQDMFSGKLLIYRPARTGYLLYSVGVNGRDDGGRDCDDEPPGDDLSVRMPLPKPRNQ
jgi:hypothetical protein